MTSKAQFRLGHIDKVELGFNDRNYLSLTFYFEMKEFLLEKYGKIVSEYSEDAILSESGSFLMWDARDASFGKDLSKLLRKAKVRDLNALKGIPIEATIIDGIIVSWRVLEEVL
jgi:hypothetical protein